jgi:hypothetical protein
MDLRDAVVNTGAFLYAKTEAGKTRVASTGGSGRAEWCVVGVANRSIVARFAEALSAVPHLSSLVSAVAAGRDLGRSFTGPGGGFAGSGQGGPERELHRWLLRRSEKGGSGVGKTKRGKGTKIMAIADRHGLPIEISVASASPHETKLVATTLEQRFTKKVPP